MSQVVYEKSHSIKCFVIGCFLGILFTGLGAGLVTFRQHRRSSDELAEQQRRASELEQRLNDSCEQYDSLAQQYDAIKRQLDATKQAIEDDCRRADQILSRNTQSIGDLREALTDLKEVLRNIYSHSIRSGDGSGDYYGEIMWDDDTYMIMEVQS